MKIETPSIRQIHIQQPRIDIVNTELFIDYPGGTVGRRERIEALLTSIRSVQQAMAGVSDSTLSNVFRISSVVESIETRSGSAKDIADNAYLVGVIFSCYHIPKQ